MIKYGFMNSKKTVSGTYDRVYTADDVNKYFEGAFSENGIFEFVGEKCEVIPGNNLSVIVKPGKGFVNFHYFYVTANENITLTAPSATLNRYTAIVVRYDAVNRNIYLTTIDGEYAERPNKPEIVRTETICDICLAYVLVKANATEITLDDIISTITDESVCGYITTLLSSESSSGIEKVSILPAPTVSNVGKIYYLTQDTKDYSRGYYATAALDYDYGFDEVAYTAEAFNNRPIANRDLVNTLFYATDTDNWYICQETSTANYEWLECVVNSVEELPTPSAETYDKYYITGDSLYKGSRIDRDYGWVSVITTSSYIRQTDDIRGLQYLPTEQETYPDGILTFIADEGD